MSTQDPPDAPQRHGASATATDVSPPRRPSLASAGLVILIFLLVLYTLYERISVLQHMERAARDFTAQIREPWENHNLWMIQIDSADYTDLFGRTSPLEVDTLQHILNAVVAGRPRAVIVDVLTDMPSHRDLGQLEESGVPIIWARGTGPCRHEQYPTCTGLVDFAGLDRERSSYGLADVEEDPDGVIRQYRRYVMVDDTLRPTLSTAVMAAVGDPPEASRDPRFITYRELRLEGVSLSASQLLRLASGPGFAEDGMLRDRIVFVGGTFPEARDEHQTPLGEMHGVEVHAQTVLTELNGGGLEPVSMGMIGFLLFLNSLGLLLLFHFVPDFKMAFWTAILGIPVFATACSWLVTESWFALWPYLVPLLIAVLIQQLYAHAVRYRNELLAQLGDRWIPKGKEEPSAL